MAQVSNQLELEQALAAKEPLIEIANNFPLRSQVNITYLVTIRSAYGASKYMLTNESTGAGPMFIVQSGGSLTLESIIIDGNGVQYPTNSAALVTYGVLILSNVIVTSVVSTGNGGGISVEENGSLSLINSNIVYNKAHTGGGIYICGHGSAKLFGSAIDRNTADYRGGGIYISTVAKIECSCVSMYGNNCPGEGGAIYTASDGTAYLNDSFTSDDNTASAGNGIYNNGNLIVMGNISIRDGAYIPAIDNFIHISGQLMCSEIQLEESTYIRRDVVDTPYLIAAGTPQYPILCRQDLCAFNAPVSGFSNRYFVIDKENTLWLIAYPEYHIVYENLLGADNPNPPSFNESTLPLFFAFPGRVGDLLFAGWFPQGLGGDAITFIPPGTVGDIVLYARWQRIRPLPCQPCLPCCGDCKCGGCNDDCNCHDHKNGCEHERKKGCGCG